MTRSILNVFFVAETSKILIFPISISMKRINVKAGRGDVKLTSGPSYDMKIFKIPSPRIK